MTLNTGEPGPHTTEGRVQDVASTYVDRTKLDTLLSYTAMNMRIFPVWEVLPGGGCACGQAHTDKREGKHPVGSLVPNGYKDATIDPDIIVKWHEERPTANWGWALDRHFALDIDPRNGFTLDDLDQWGATFGFELPPTLIQKTGGDGRHLIYEQPNDGQVRNGPLWFPDTRQKVPGAEIKGVGGYILIAPSNHKSGGRYDWLNWGQNPVPGPSGLLGLLRRRSADGTNGQDSGGLQGGQREWTAERVTRWFDGDVPPGEQRNELLSFIGYQRMREEPVDNIIAMAWSGVSRFSLGRSDEPWTYEAVERAVRDRCADLPEGRSVSFELTETQRAAVDRWTPSTDDKALAAFRQEVQKEYQRARVREAVRQLQRDDEAGLWTPPEDLSLGELLLRPATSERMLIDDLLGWLHNGSFTAQYKTGKTTAGINVMRSLVDGEPFLGQDTHLPSGARVAWWNGEMSADDLATYARVQGIRSPERIVPLNLRGQRMDILADHVAEWVTEWLRRREVAVWWVDSWRVLCAWAGVDENDNTGGARLVRRIDEIKREAGVLAFVTLAHTPRAQLAEGQERSRGMTTLDDWVDVRWVMTREGGTRFFRAEGRGVAFGGDTGTALVFDEQTQRLTLGEGDRRRHRADAGLDVVVAIVKETPNLNKRQLKEAIRDADGGPTNTDVIGELIDRAIARQLIHIVSGPNRQQFHRPGPDPRAHWTRPAIENEHQ